MFQDITLYELFQLKKEQPYTTVDVRSPKEFAEGTIPGSMNIPIFTDNERAEVGTLYKEKGIVTAKERGLEIFSQKLPSFIQSFKQIQTPITVFCWRGGMRSKTAATVLDLMGITATRLQGGVKTYRRWVVKTLETIDFSPKMVVLNGYTGTGKTKIIHQLAKEGIPTLDFEGLAGHRGSIFGHIGKKPSNQKTFESRLVQELLRYQNSPYIIVEGESKRIGKAVLPSFLFEKKDKGLQVFIHLPMEERVNNILDDYKPAEHLDACEEAFEHIQKRIHTPVAKQIRKNLNNGRFAEAVGLLLGYYYDPRYEHSTDHFPDEQRINIYADTIDEAANKVRNLLIDRFDTIR